MNIAKTEKGIASSQNFQFLTNFKSCGFAAIIFILLQAILGTFNSGMQSGKPWMQPPETSNIYYQAVIFHLHEQERFEISYCSIDETVSNMNFVWIPLSQI